MMMQTLIGFLANIKFKNDKGLVALAIVLAVVVGALVLHKDVEPKVALAFLAGAYALPGFFGRGAGDAPAPSVDSTKVDK